MHLKESLKLGAGNGIKMAIPGFIVSFLIVFFIVGMPGNEVANGITNGVSGFISCMMGGIMTAVTSRKAHKGKRPSQDDKAVNG